MWLAWGKGAIRDEAPALPGRPAAEPRPAPGWPAAIGLLIAIAGALGFVAFFIAGNNAQKIGGSLALGFLGLGFALAYWGRDLTDDEVEIDRYPLPPAASDAGPDGTTADVPAALGDALAGSAAMLTRRDLTTLLIGAAAVLGLSQLALAATLGPRSRGLFSTAWTPGARLVTIDGVPITSDALAGGGIVVAFPKGHTERRRLAGRAGTPAGLAPLPGREPESRQLLRLLERLRPRGLRRGPVRRQSQCALPLPPNRPSICAPA